MVRENKPLTGKQLRHSPSRRTKDGSFLTTLINQGLIAINTIGETPFLTTYVLTERGKHGAEYGEHDPRISANSHELLQQQYDRARTADGISGGSKQVLRSSTPVSNKRSKPKGNSKGNRKLTRKRLNKM
jgi:hypothetical protein